MTTSGKHRHFKLGSAETPYREQERDLAIGLWLARRRFLDADQICRLVENHEGGSHAHTRTRLTKMFRNRLLVKPKGQKEYWDECGRRDHIYGNSSVMGAKLQRRGLAPTGRLDWTQRNKQAGREFIEHAVETSELMVSFETTTRRYPGLALREIDELVDFLPEKTRAISQPWYFESLPYGFPTSAKRRVRPDAVFSLRQTGNGHDLEQFFVAEIDCTSMPVVRGEKLERKLEDALADATAKGPKTSTSTLAESAVAAARYELLLHNVSRGQRSFLQKFTTYFWAYKQDWHKTHLGWPSFRVLVSTRTESHRDRMIEALHYVTDGHAPNLFLFTTQRELRAADDLFQHEWINGAGERVRLSG